MYATAELLSIEYENGILAMEFAAPQAGEVILQLARMPVGPFLAAGKPTEFDWDERRCARACRFRPAAGRATACASASPSRSPETSAFFNDPRRLVIGQKNMVSTMYSSAEVAARSRLRLPEGFTATPRSQVAERDRLRNRGSGGRDPRRLGQSRPRGRRRALGRARLQLFRPRLGAG